MTYFALFVIVYLIYSIFIKKSLIVIYKQTDENGDVTYIEKRIGSSITIEEEEDAERGGDMERRKGVIMLRPARYKNNMIPAVGESFYRHNLESIESTFGYEVIATLVPDDDNQHDRNAVRVEIDGLAVGHLSRDDAALFRRTHAKAIAEKKPIDCYAELRGGPRAELGIGVFLDFALGMETRYTSQPK